jgi:hypothetical protein
MSEQRRILQSLGTTPESALREHIAAWVGGTLANRAIVEPVEGTERGFIGKVKGVPSVLVCSAAVPNGETQVLEELHAKLTIYAERLIAAGKPLPVWEKPPVTVPPEVRGLVRLSRLRTVLLQRAGEWGTQRKNLPAHAIDSLLADLDQLITRHANAMASTAATLQPSSFSPQT